MPTFTLELFRVLELTDDIGLNDYPIFAEGYREGLNRKITDRYLMREIGFETVDMFRFGMRRRMNEIMPTYNRLFESERLIVDPLRTVDMRTVSHDTSAGESSQTSAGDTETVQDGGSRAVTSNTPQVQLQGRGDYATSAADTTSKNTGSGSSNEQVDGETLNTSDSESTVQGYSGSPSALLAEYRRTFLPIDVMILDDLDDLFMGIWDNGDDYMSAHRFTRM